MTTWGGIILLLSMAAAAYLGLQLMLQINQRKQLARWLESPDPTTLPNGHGAWREVFSRLQRLRKEERQGQVILRNTLEHFRLAVQAIPDGVVLLDKEGYIEWLNPAACGHFNLNVERDIGTLIEQLVRQSEFLVYLGAFRAGESPPAVQFRRNGSEPEIVLAVILLPFADAGMLLLSRDITDLARTEAMRRDFVANVSHELRTPLTVLSGFLEQFDSATPPAGDAARHFLRLMTEQADRMNRLVADLLTLSRLENNSAPPADEEVDVPALLGELLLDAQALSAGRHHIAIGTAMPSRLRGSPDELRSAFGNLLFNAVRYTPAGGTITLEWRSEDGAPVFTVTDTGIGIPAEHIPRLTERFYRVDKGRSTASGGTGLGLAIVKHVLARHGGSLHINSVPGRGSSFSARFPNKRVVSSGPT